jgi:hypothetical protein
LFFLLSGEWDGAGAVVKSKLHQEQLRNDGRKLQCAHDVVTFLEDSLTIRVASSYPDKKKKKRDIY